MALVNIKEMLEKARKEHYAVGAFDASTIEMAMAIVEAAEEEKSPVIVMGLTPDLQQGNEKMLTYWTESLKDLAKKASVPVCLHLFWIGLIIFWIVVIAVFLYYTRNNAVSYMTKLCLHRCPIFVCIVCCFF